MVLAAGCDLATLRDGTPTLSISGRIEAGETYNVVARNPVPGTPLLLTTPLTGWFGCAGERGTGLAVLLHLVNELKDLPLLVVLTGGHELGYFGAHRWVDECVDRPQAIVHIGASIAVDEPVVDGERRKLTAMRLAMCSLGADRCAGIDQALAGAELAATVSTEHFIGEGEAWSRLGVPLLSTTGAGVDFHTPEDLAPRVTSPASLAAVGDAMSAAALELLNATQETR